MPCAIWPFSICASVLPVDLVSLTFESRLSCVSPASSARFLKSWEMPDLSVKRTGSRSSAEIKAASSSCRGITPSPAATRASASSTSILRCTLTASLALVSNSAWCLSSAFLVACSDKPEVSSSVCSDVQPIASATVLIKSFCDFLRWALMSSLACTLESCMPNSLSRLTRSLSTNLLLCARSECSCLYSDSDLTPRNLSILSLPPAPPITRNVPELSLAGCTNIGTPLPSPCECTVIHLAPSGIGPCSDLKNSPLQFIKNEATPKSVTIDLPSDRHLNSALPSSI